MSEEISGSGPGDDDSGKFGWFAFAPDPAGDIGHDAEPAIRKVELRDDKCAGPFWDDQGHLSDSFEDLHAWLGISRGLFDDAVAWNSERGLLGSDQSDDWKRRHFDTQQELLRRLSQEVRPGIEVASPRDEPPTLVQLSRLNVDADSAHLVLWDAVAVETGQAKVMPPVPHGLTRIIMAWIADIGTYEEATSENCAAILAWQDEGSGIARQLQQFLGGDYHLMVL